MVQVVEEAKKNKLIINFHRKKIEVFLNQFFVNKILKTQGIYSTIQIPNLVDE